MLNAKRAAAQVVPAAEESDASVPCCGMNGWQSRSTTPPGTHLRSATRGWWRVPRTTPYEARRQSPEPKRGSPRGAPSPTGTDATSPGDAASTPRRGAAQGCVERHVVEHMADVCPVVQTLDAPMPQMVDTVLEFFRALDLPVDEQVIAVPKISTDRVSQRLVERRLPQMVEQLVEVPTVVSYSSLSQRTVEQTVDNPASRGRGRGGGLQGFFPGQSTTAAAVDIPVPRGDLQGFLPGQVSTASSSHSLDAENETEKKVFPLFPVGKEVRRPQPSRVRSCPPVSAHGRGRLMRTWMLRTSRRRWRTTRSP